MRLTCSTLLVLSGALPAFSTPESQAAAQIPFLSRPLQLADYLHGQIPRAALRIGDFRQRQPADGAPASLSTTAFLAYGDSALYVLFICRDAPENVRAHLSRRESVGGDDLVGVAIDSYRDGRRAYQFYANPLGVQLDGLIAEGQSDDYKFDTVWESDGRVTADGFVVRIAIPFKSIRSRMGPGQQWGIALTRRITRNNEYDTWPRITDKIEAYVPQFAAVNAPVTSAPRTGAILNPYGFAADKRVLDAGAAAVRRNQEVRAGVDSTILFGDRVALDLTVNPDFSQVESDEPQVTANRRYEVYYPEKRPFFLENATLFQTPETLFFSRRILDPEFGARVTGKAGPWAFGALAMDDRAGASGDGDPRARIGVVRLQREVGRESSVGALLTTRRTAAGSNAVGGLDLRWKASPHWVLSAQGVVSQLSQSGNIRNGSDLFADIRYTGRHFNYSTTLRDRSADFVAELGFIPRVDIRQSQTDVSYRWRPESGPVTSFGPSIDSVVTYDHAGKMQDWSVETPFTLDFRGPSSISVSHIAGNEVFGGRRFRRDGNRLVVSTDRWQRFGVTASLARGRAINYYPAAGLEPFGGESTDAGFELTFHASSRIRFDESYFYSRLSSAGRSVLDDHTARSKVNLQFTRAASLRLILDYNGTLAHPQWIDQSRTKRLAADVLFTYLLHPGTALYIGYNEGRENWASFEQGRSALVRGGSPSVLSGSQVFVKFSYLFRM